MIEKFALPFSDAYWHCSHCDHLNAAEAKACLMCGTLRVSDQVESEGCDPPTSATATCELVGTQSGRYKVDMGFRPFIKEAKDIQEGGTHYKDMKIEPWDVIDTWPIEQQIGYHRGNLLKYTMRMGRKDNDIQEIEKAGHYAQKLKEVLDHARKENRTEGI